MVVLYPCEPARAGERQRHGILNGSRRCEVQEKNQVQEKSLGMRSVGCIARSFRKVFVVNTRHKCH